MTTKKVTKKRAPNKAKRVVRQPFGGPRLKLAVNVEDNPRLKNFHICWVTEDRIPEYEQDGGYTYVSRDELGSSAVGEKDIGHGNTELGAHISRVTTRATGQKSYLMKLPLKFHLQDLAAQEERNRVVDDALQAGLVDDIAPGHTQKRPEHNFSVRTRG